MAKAKMVEELILSVPNEVGVLANVANELSSSGINILHMCAYVKEEKGYFMLVTSDNTKAAALLKDMGYKPSLGQTLEIEVEK